jgi:two-component system cell cycle response regulator
MESNKLLSERAEYFPLSLYKQGVKILTVTQLDKLSDTVLDSLIEETGTQGGVLWLRDIEQPDQFVLSAARGLSKMENEMPRFKSSGSDRKPEGFPFKGVTPKIHKDCLYVPLRSEGKLLGLAKITEKPGGKKLGLRERKVAQTISTFSGIAIKNARRLEMLGRRGFKDNTTRSYNLAYLSDYVEKEIRKARRYNRTFSLIGLKIDNYQEIQKNFGQTPLAQTVERIILSLSELLRESDIIARVSEREIYIFMPETDYFGSLILVRRIDKVLRSKRYISDPERDPRDVGELVFSLGSAAFPRDGTDFDSLTVKITSRMEEHRSSIYKKLNLEEKGFWEVVGLLLGKAGYKATEDIKGLSRHHIFTPSLIEQTQKVIFREIAQNPDMRGILYMGVRRIDPGMSLLENHQIIEASATRVFILGQPAGAEGNEDKSWDIPQITPVFLSDERILQHTFILYLNEDYAYGLICRKDKQGKLFGFHTGDSTLVERMISKLQENYMLKKQL